MSFEFRQYSTDEPCYQQAWGLREQVLRRPLGLSLTRQDCELDALCWHYGLFKDGRILATVTAQPLSDSIQATHQVKLRQMVVDNAYQGQGLGLLLLKQVEEALIDKSIHEIRLASRDTAVGFYKKLGYEKQGPTYHHLRIGHQDMVKIIESKTN